MVDRAYLLAHDTGSGGDKAVLTDLQGRVLHSAYCPYPVHIAPGCWILAGEMETGGGALMWFRDVFCQEEARRAEKARLSTYQVLSQMVDTVEPGADRLLFAPWLSGERAPVLKPLRTRGLDRPDSLAHQGTPGASGSWRGSPIKCAGSARRSRRLLHRSVP